MRVFGNPAIANSGIGSGSAFLRGMACMNSSCGATAAAEWMRGWRLRSGGFASLCDKCGSAYEQLNFCETFHNDDSGWRDCSSCGKRLHCGCVASNSFYELLDRGGVECVGCMKKSGISLSPGEAFVGVPIEGCSRVIHSIPKSSMLEKLSISSSLAAFCREESSPVVETNHNAVLERNNGTDCRKEQNMLLRKDWKSNSFPSTMQHALTSQGEKKDEMKETNSTSSSSFMFATMSPKVLHAVPGLGMDRLDGDKLLSPFQQGHKSRNILPKPPKAAPIIGMEIPKDSSPQMRVARPPVEGRGRNQLLPRYWPRITEQELQQISGDSNSTIVPLFEKVLSASDAGRIGRLVLPKACAEAYFPSISQAEGLPLKIQDSKGKDWMFQFRFWPNNNSRMYVLEGVTPCIQSMQLQAGDTVTFSRLEPEGKLVMGSRKASTSSSLQDILVPVSSVPNETHAKDNFPGGIGTLPVLSGYSGLLKSLKGNADPHLTALSDRVIDGDVSWLKPNTQTSKPIEGSHSHSLSFPERKKSRNISSKNKRLHIEMEDALELKVTWEEAQTLLRPPPSVKPSIVLVDDYEFEEYEEPPVFGKKTIFTAKPFGGQDQWAQCDSCYKWRRLPSDVLLQSRWTCAENVWDPKRSSCAVPDEINSKELADVPRTNSESKKRRAVDPPRETYTEEQTGLDALASAVLGDEENCNLSSAARTTKHPRHRPGCMCIVCIQPPSGKGPKHKPTCTCNVCSSVKRRFTTLMMRKRNKQMDKVAETGSKKIIWNKDESEVDSSVKRDELEQSQGNSSPENKVVIDLNCQPGREDELRERGGMSMINLLRVELNSLTCEQQDTAATASSSSLALPPTTVDSDDQATEDNKQLADAAFEVPQAAVEDGRIDQS